MGLQWADLSLRANGNQTIKMGDGGWTLPTRGCSECATLANGPSAQNTSHSFHGTSTRPRRTHNRCRKSHIAVCSCQVTTITLCDSSELHDNGRGKRLTQRDLCASVHMCVCVSVRGTHTQTIYAFQLL